MSDKIKIKWELDNLRNERNVEKIAEALLIIDGLTDMELDLQSATVNFCAAGSDTVETARKTLVKSGFHPRNL